MNKGMATGHKMGINTFRSKIPPVDVSLAKGRSHGNATDVKRG